VKTGFRASLSVGIPRHHMYLLSFVYITDNDRHFRDNGVDPIRDEISWAVVRAMDISTLLMVDLTSTGTTGSTRA
jgi:hypothetical protein